MAKNDFKTAAAKLLEQHSSKLRKAKAEQSLSEQNKVSPKPAPKVESKPPNPVPKPRSIVPAFPVSTVEEHHTYHHHHKPQRGSSKGLLFISLIVVACAITVFAVPESIFGIGGNIAVGVLIGGGLAFVINREVR